MSNIDFSQVVTAEVLAAKEQAHRAEVIKSECRRRILSVLTETAQMNMALNAGAGLLDATQQDAYRAALTWRDAMRATCAQLIDDPAADYGDDDLWPEVPAVVVDLAAAS